MANGGKERPEEGKHYEVREMGTGVTIGRGFVRLLLGDHGPYMELRGDHIVRSKLECESTTSFWFDLFRTTANTKVYRQKKSVTSINPPQTGDWYTNNYRKGGYAGYVPGLWYIAADQVKIVEVDY